jgi:hypothetical protein
MILGSSKPATELLASETQRLADACRHFVWMSQLGHPEETKTFKLLAADLITRIQSHLKELK